MGPRVQWAEQANDPSDSSSLGMSHHTVRRVCLGKDTLDVQTLSPCFSLQSQTHYLRETGVSSLMGMLFPFLALEVVNLTQVKLKSIHP